MPPFPKPQASFVAVYRKDGRVWRMNLSEPAYRVLEALCAKKPLGTALTAGRGAEPAQVKPAPFDRVPEDLTRRDRVGRGVGDSPGRQQVPAPRSRSGTTTGGSPARGATGCGPACTAAGA